MESVDFYIKDQVGYITLNQAEKQNALNLNLINKLQEAFRQAESDAACRVIVLKATGDTFCIGAETELPQAIPNDSFISPDQNTGQLLLLYRQIYTLKKVVIAQVQGRAIGDGCGLAAVCDLVFAVPDAVLGFPEVRMDLVPAGISVFLVRKIGEDKTKQLLLTGDLLSAAQALDLGLIHFVIPASDLEKSVNDLAQRMSNENSGSAMSVTKEIISQVAALDLEAGLAFATGQHAMHSSTPEKQRAMVAFLAKQKKYW